MKADDYVKQIMRERCRSRRAAMLARVPFNLRERVKREVEWKWQQQRQPNTRSR